jgi:hypothetical protein
VTIRPGGVFSGATLLVDGRPAEKSRRQYRVPLRDGTTVSVQLRAAFTRPVPTVVADGRAYEIGPRIGAGYVVLIFLPLALAFVGGVIGGVLGGIGCALNRNVAFSGKPWWVRVPTMLGIHARHRCGLLRGGGAALPAQEITLTRSTRLRACARTLGTPDPG